MAYIGLPKALVSAKQAPIRCPVLAAHAQLQLQQVALCIPVSTPQQGRCKRTKRARTAAAVNSSAFGNDGFGAVGAPLVNEINPEARVRGLWGLKVLKDKLSGVSCGTALLMHFQTPSMPNHRSQAFGAAVLLIRA